MKMNTTTTITNIELRYVLNPGLSDAKRATGWTKQFPATKTGLALALDAARYENERLAGSYGDAHTSIIAIGDDEAEIIDDGYPDDGQVDASSLSSELPDGEPLTIDDFVEYEGAVWDGHNHVVVIATHCRAMAVETERRETDGSVTWVYDDYGDGVESLVNMVIDDGFAQLDYYATNGYGNESSSAEYAVAEKFVSVAKQFGINAEMSLISDGASNEAAEAWVLVVPDDDLSFAELAYSRFIEENS